MATYYWVGGAGTWDTSSTTNWASSSNGAGGAGVPTSADNVIIDTSSGTGTITCTAGVCLDLTVTATQAITLGAASSTLSVFGNLTFPSGGSFSVISSSTITFASTTGKTITTNGKSLGGIIFNGVGGGWTLGSALVSGATLTLTNGTLDTSSTSNYSLTVSNVQLNAGTKTFNLNASTVTLSGNVNFLTNATGFTLNAGTSTITFTGNGSVLTTGGFTYYNVTWTGSYMYTPQIVGSATYNNLSFNYTTTGNFIHYISGTQTVNGTFTVRAGAASSPTTIAGGIAVGGLIGTQGTIVANAVSSLSYINFRDIVISGNAISGGNLTGTNLGDCGNNSGITFPASKTVYWNLPAGGNWYSNAWALTSGGTVNLTNTPLPQDSVIIQDTGLNSGATITLTNQHNGAIDFSSRTLPMTLAVGASSIYWYGNIKYSSAITITGTGQFTFSKQNATQQITSSGITHPIQITVNTPATVQLQDAFTTASTVTVTLTQGTLDLNNFNLTCGLFNFSNTNTRAISFGTGQIYLTGSNASIWASLLLTGFTCTGSKIVNCTYSGSVGTRSIQHGQNGGQLADYSNVVSFNVTGGTDTFSFSIGNKMMNVNLTGFAGTLTATNASSTINIYGNLILPNTISSINYTNLSTITFGGLAGVTQQITTGGNSLPNITFNGTATTTYQLQDALTVGSVYTTTLTTGTLDANNYNVTTGLFAYSGTSTKAILMGSGTWSLTGTGTVWNANATGTTLTRGTSQINTTSTSIKTFAGGGQTYYNLSNTGSGALTITGNNTYNNLSALGGCPVTITSNTTQSANTFTFQGASSITIAPSSTTNYTLTKLGGGIVDMQNVSISRCTATPSTGTWYAGASTDGGNNTGIRFVSAPKFQQMF